MLFQKDNKAQNQRILQVADITKSSARDSCMLDTNLTVAVANLTPLSDQVPDQEMRSQTQYKLFVLIFLFDNEYL